MKQFVIKTGENDDYGQYTLFKNTNTKLKNKVASVQLPNKFDTCMPWDTWEIESYEGDEVKCVSGRNVKYFPREEVKEYQIEQRKKDVMKEFSSIKDFFDCYGPLYTKDYRGVEKVYYNSFKLTDKEIEEMTDEEKRRYEIQMEDFDKDYYFSVSIERSSKEKPRKSDHEQTIEFKISEGYQICFLHYHSDGNFINRDYNIKLQDYTQERISFRKEYEEFINIIRSFKKIGYTDKKINFYTDKFCLTPYIAYYYDPKKIDPRHFCMTVTSAISEDTYKAYRSPAIKRPKNLKYMTGDEFVAYLEETYLKTILEIIHKEDNS